MKSQKRHLSCLWFRLITTQLFVISLINGKIDCPSECICELQYNRTKVNCNTGSLHEIPRLGRDTISFKTYEVPVTEIYPNAFNPALKLNRIVLVMKQLRNISVDGFNGLTELQTLTIKVGKYIHMDPNTLSGLTNLQTLTLKLNFSHFPSELLCAFKNHIYSFHLRLNDNQIRHISIQNCVASSFPKLDTLEISSNPITSIEAGDFLPLANTSLTTLMLADCLFTEVKADVFRYLPQIKQINLSGNKLLTIREGTFSTLTHLITVTLGGPHITSLPQDIGSSSTLTTLTLCGNKNTSWNFTPIFQKSSSLNFISLEGLFLGVIDERYFKNLQNSSMTTLAITSCKIMSLTTNAFQSVIHMSSLTLNEFHRDLLSNISEAVSCTNLITLKMGHVISLTQLNGTDFKGLSDTNTIHILEITNSRLDTIAGNTFKQFQNVTSLSLVSNKLTYEGLSRNCLSGMDYLQKLHLDQNILNNIPSGGYLGLTSSNVSGLYFRGNHIINNLSPIRGFPNLLHLDISMCSIKRLRRDVFKNLTKLESLDLAHNSISNLKNGLFDGLRSLKYLLLNSNKIATMGSELFVAMRELRSLTLDKNEFNRYVRIDTIFQNLTQLQKLDLTSCGLNSLPYYMFQGLQSLDSLYLSDNHISSWHPEVFEPLTSLTSLALSSNKITLINQTSFQHLPLYIDYIHLADNPFLCNCATFSFTQWMIASDINFPGLTTNYTCAFPTEQHHKSLIRYMTTTNCLSTMTVTMTLAITAAMCSMFLICSIVYQYRWYVRYYFYLLRLGRPGDMALDNSAREYQYDAFVCYHKSSSRMVITSMIPQLQYKSNCKLCLPNRDWPVGHAVVDTIVSSIKHSRKTILLVNNAFARSAWCQEISEIAFSKMVTERRDLLVVVLLEHIEPRNMRPTLRTILTTRPYLTWPDTHIKQERFWEAIRKTLNNYE